MPRLPVRLSGRSLLRCALLRNLVALGAGFGNANRDRLLPTFYRAACAAFTTLERTGFEFLHDFADLFPRLSAVLARAFFCSLPRCFACTLFCGRLCAFSCALLRGSLPPALLRRGLARGFTGGCTRALLCRLLRCFACGLLRSHDERLHTRMWMEHWISCPTRDAQNCSGHAHALLCDLNISYSASSINIRDMQNIYTPNSRAQTLRRI